MEALVNGRPALVSVPAPTQNAPKAATNPLIRRFFAMLMISLSAVNV